MSTDKKSSAPSSTRAKQADSDVEHAIGGQPESDQDARDAGLPSATSAAGAEKPARDKSKQQDDDV